MILKRHDFKMLIGLLVILNCASSEVYIRNDIDYKKYTRIAVFPLVDYPTKPGSGLQVADIISAQLINSNYNIIDRSQTTRILQEQQLSMSGVIDERTVPSIGKILGVQAILTGSINEYQCTPVNIQVAQGARPAYIYVSAAGISLKLIDCETGQVIWAGSARGTEMGQNAEIFAARKAVKNILEKFKKLKIDTRQEMKSKVREQYTETVFPNLRANYPQYNEYTDEQIIEAFRKNNPQYNNKSDIWIIKYIEKKAKK